MKNYYEALKKYITVNYPKDSERMKRLESVKNDQVKLIKLYNEYKSLSKAMNKTIDESSKMSKSKFKEYIKEIITSTLSESTIDTPNPSTLSPSDKQKLINTARVKTKDQKLGTSEDPVDFVESELTELEPNSKQKLKLANKELAFLAKQVRALEKQLKSQGSDENEG
jgi:hypothetical protein